MLPNYNMFIRVVALMTKQNIQGVLEGTYYMLGAEGHRQGIYKQKADVFLLLLHCSCW